MVAQETNKKTPKEAPKEQKPENPKKDESSKRLRRNRCCCLGLLGLGILLVIVMSVRLHNKTSADIKVPLFTPSATEIYPITTNPGSTSTPLANTPAPADENPASENPVPAADTSLSKQAQIDYFINVAIRDEDKGNAEFPLRKWAKNNVTIQTVGPSTSSAEQCINDTILAINSFSSTMNLSRTDGSGDIVLNLTDRATLEARGFSTGGFYYFDPPSGSNYNLTGVSAYAATDYWPGEDVSNCQIIRHELTHAIGLPYNASGYDYSIFGVPSSTTNEYQEIDKQMIKMLYNTGISSGLNEANARAYLANASW